MKTVVITGVSSGLGQATAEHLANQGYAVYGSVRKADDAQFLVKKLGDRFTPLLFDVTDSQAIGTAVTQVKEAIGDANLDVLINNAGIVLPGPLKETPLSDFRAHFEVNLFGLLDVTQQFLPLLGTRKNAPHPRGRIVNISSVSGKIAYPFMGAYAASKHALEALSDALRRELMLYDIDVILIEPGTTNTPIKDKYAKQIERYRSGDYGDVFEGLEKQLVERETSGLPVEKVVQVIATAVTSSSPRARYPIPRKRLTGWLIPRWLPDRWLDRIIAGRLALKNKKRPQED